MSDIGLTTDNAPPVEVTQPTPAPAATDPLSDLPENQAVFDRGYVEKVRGEAQRYREEARTASAAAERYNQVFGVYDEADRGVWLDLASTWATDPNRAAQIMQQIASGVLGDQDAGAGTAGPSSPGDQPETPTFDGEELTPERVQELIEEKFTAREAKQAEAQAVEEVYAEVRQAGFDPNTAEGFMVLWNANHFTNGDITEAVKMTNSYKQSIIDGYVQGRSTGAVPMPSQGGVQATNLAEPITNLEDAKKATDAYLRERRGA